MSIIHMNITIIVITISINVEWNSNYSWHHHSIITGVLFFLIGWIYAISSSRIIKILLHLDANLDNITKPIFIILIFIIITISLDLPWTSNFFIELHFFKCIKTNIIILLCFVLFYCCIIITLIKLCINKNIIHVNIVSNIKDIESNKVNIVLIISITIAILGYILSIQFSYY